MRVLVDAALDTGNVGDVPFAVYARNEKSRDGRRVGRVLMADVGGNLDDINIDNVHRCDGKSLDFLSPISLLGKCVKFRK